MVFSPRVINLFASGIRSGLAFSFVLIAIMYLNGLRRYFTLLVSIFLHASMAPIVAFFLLSSA